MEAIMISDKMKTLTERNAVVREMFEEGARLCSIYGSENVYDFSLGNPNFPAPDAVGNAIIDIVKTVDPIKLHGYTPGAGFKDVRAAIASSLNARFQTPFDDRNIILTSGAAGALNVVFKTLLNPGDEVIAIAPYFFEYDHYVSNYGGKLIAVPSNPEDFLPDSDKLRDAVTEKTKAVILNSPNNPTGVIYSKETIEEISLVLTEKQREFRSSIYIVSDEPYRELAYDGTDVPFLTGFYKNTLVCYSWSKSLSLPGERIGYIIVPTEADEYDLIFEAACISARIMGFVNASALMQMTVARCLDEKTDISGYDDNRKLLYKTLKELGFDPILPQGAFYIWMKTNCDEAAFIAAAKKFNILLVPGSSFGCPGYVRIAYCVSKKTIESSIPAFEMLAKELGVRNDGNE